MGFRVTGKDDHVLNPDTDEADAELIARRYKSETGHDATIQRFGDVDEDKKDGGKGQEVTIGAGAESSK